MIKITHTNCWNVRRKATIIGCNASAFHGIGVPLQVILHAFLGKEVVWFSSVYGQFKDNTLLIAIHPSLAANIEKIKHSEASPMQTAIGTAGEFEEYILSDKVQKELGINIEENTYTIKQQENVLYRIHVHDDCYPLVEPIDQELLHKLVQCILLQHSYYQGIEVDWSRVLEAITQEVSKTKRFLIKSHRNGHYLIMRKALKPWEFMSEIRELLFPHSFCAVNIADDKAYFSASYLKKLGIN